MARRTDIDTAKGLAILLVVFGHLVARGDPVGVEWYEPLRRAVYSFHMPFFLYLSGLVTALSGNLLLPAPQWRGAVRVRARRLLVPFLALGVLIVLGKTLAGRVMFVDNLPGGVFAGLAALVWHTQASPALSIWYLFVLFVVSLASMAFLRGDPGRLKILLALSLVIYIAPLPATMYLDHIGRYAVFFVIGAWAGQRDAGWTRLIDQVWPVCLAIFLAAIAAVVFFGAAWPPAVDLLPIGIVSMPALHGLLRYLPPSSTRVFLWLGRYSFMIYLFNTLFIGLSKGVLLHVAAWRAPDFLPLAVALMTAGVFGPVALKRFGFRHIRSLDRLTD